METKERVMRRNLLGRSGGPAEGNITFMAFGGARMVLSRNGIQEVEIWSAFGDRIFFSFGARPNMSVDRTESGPRL